MVELKVGNTYEFIDNPNRFLSIPWMKDLCGVKYIIQNIDDREVAGGSIVTISIFGRKAFLFAHSLRACSQEIVG